MTFFHDGADPGGPKHMTQCVDRACPEVEYHDHEAVAPAGWYWRRTPDDVPHGPFDSEREAMDDAVNG